MMDEFFKEKAWKTIPNGTAKDGTRQMHSATNVHVNFDQIVQEELVPHSSRAVKHRTGSWAKT